MQDAEKHNIAPGQSAFVPVKIITTEGLEMVRLVTEKPSPAYPDGTHFGLHCSQIIVRNGNSLIPELAQPELSGLAKFLQKHFGKELNHDVSIEQNAIKIIQRLANLK